tara:strand:+ start:85 stop:546 length:462 start_codon:yes stop_codon:yes gene_type:complete
MARFKYRNFLLLTIFLIPSAIGEAQISANNQLNYLSVDSGQTVFFNATGVQNTTSIEWDFGIDISGPETRYSNLTSINHTVHAAGRYNITFTANYEDKTETKELVLIVNYVETFEEQVVYNEALFFAIAGAELIMSIGLGYWTQQIKKEKTYL